MCGCVAQVCLHRFDVVTGIEGGNGEAVAQIVEPGILRDPGAFGDLFEVFDHGAAYEIFTRCIGEHQIEFVVPETPGQSLFPLLPLLLSAEGIHHQRGREDGAALAALGRFQEVIAVLALKLLLDRDDAGLEIHALPAKSKQLALPHSGEHGGDKQVAVIVLLGLLEKLGNLVRFQRLDLRLDHLWQLAGICGIGADVVVGDGLLEGAVEDAMDILDGLGGETRSGQIVVKPLNGVGVQCFQFGCAQSGLQVLLHLFVVVELGQGLQIAQILCYPDVQPLGHGHFAGGFVGACVDGSGGGLQLLGDFLLGLAGDAALDLLAGSGIKALRIPGFVVGVLLALYGFGDLPDGTHTGSGFVLLFALRHKNTPFVAA